MTLLPDLEERRVDLMLPAEEDPEQSAFVKVRPATQAGHVEIERATRLATLQLNHRAKPWVWQRPSPSPRHYRRSFNYRI